jgi:hypothetical protein
MQSLVVKFLTVDARIRSIEPSRQSECSGECLHDSPESGDLERYAYSEHPPLHTHRTDPPTAFDKGVLHFWWKFDSFLIRIASTAGAPELARDSRPSSSSPCQFRGHRQKGIQIGIARSRILMLTCAGAKSRRCHSPVCVSRSSTGGLDALDCSFYREEF